MPADILIVDDYDDNRELLRLLLEGAGHSVREAGSGQAGLQMALEEAPALVLVDLSMPGLDGWGVLRALRADERTRHIPCAAVTAFDDGERDRALAQGFDAYLPKPYHRTELLETVGHLLARGRERGGMTNAG
jgi:two-component system cell cycle response regulator DivK